VHVDLAEFRSAYLDEVEEHLNGVDGLLMRLEDGRHRGQPQLRDLRELMRLLHTIKGLSAMVGVEAIVVIAHRMETIVRSTETSGHRMDEAALEALMAGSRAMASRVKALVENRDVPPPPDALLTALNSAMSRECSSAEAAEVEFDAGLGDKLGPSERQQLLEGVARGLRAVRIDFTPSSERARAGWTITTVRDRLGAVAEIVKVVPIGAPRSAAAPGGLVFALVLLTTASDATLAEMVGGSTADVKSLVTTSAPAAAPYAAEEIDVAEMARPGVIRVEIERVDEAIDGLSALTTTRFRLSHAVRRLAQSGVDTRELSLVMADHERQLRDMRAAILRVRMVPLTTVFERLPLLVRSLTKTSKKRARLEIDSGGAEVDKAVAERLFPALVHLIRNAIDHGLESPEERVRAGKPEEGLVRISCETKSRQVEVRIADDGKGIDRARVAARAGRDASDSATLLSLLCAPGLSTRAEADATSGRGMGMDIARRVVVDRLGGELALDSTGPGGTAFVLRIPLTIAIIDSFAVRCGDERFVVPVPLVDEIVELEASMVVCGPCKGDTQTRFFVRHGATVPLVELAKLLRVPTASGGRQALVVRRSREEPLAFAVERVLGQQETVVRPLDDPLVNVSGISGATDLGDGRATLVLDLVTLSARLEQAEAA